MEMLKKNMVSLIMLVVAVLSVVAVFVWPIPGLYTGPTPKSLTKELAASVDTGSRILALLHSTHSLPNLSADNVDPKPLGGFPNTQVIDLMTGKIKEFTKKADDMYQAAIAANKHKLLVDNELPNPGAQEQYKYADQYIHETKDYTRWQKILNSGARPTVDQVNKATDALKEELTKQMGVVDSSGAITSDSKTKIDQAVNEQSPLVEPKLEMEAATHCSVYLEDKKLLGVDASINVNNLPTPNKIFSTQLAMWCLDDFCTAVAKCNAADADSDSPGGQPKLDVLHDPIKQIEQVAAPLPVAGVGGGSATAQLTKDFSPGGGAFTGRTCNGLYDVVTYQVQLVVDAEKLPMVIRDLQKGQFLTITSVNIQQVLDPAIESVPPTGGYRFGDKPCVEVYLTVEELFIHQWTNDILPTQFKTNLGANAPGGGAMQIDNGLGGDTSGGATPDSTGR